MYDSLKDKRVDDALAELSIPQMKCESCELVFDADSSCHCDLRDRQWKPWGYREEKTDGNSNKKSTERDDQDVR